MADPQNSAAANADANLQLDEFSEAMGDRKLESNPAQIDRPASDAADGTPEALKNLYDIPVNITAVLGTTHIEVNSLLELEKGDVVELDRKVGEAIDIYVNNRLVARGEVVLVDSRLGITMTEIIKSNQLG